MSDEFPERLAAILQVTPEAMSLLLNLPEGAYIDGSYAPLDTPGVMEFRIFGAGWPTSIGGTIRRTGGSIIHELHDDGSETRKVSWDFPNHEPIDFTVKIKATGNSPSAVADFFTTRPWTGGRP